MENCGYCGAELERDEDGRWADAFDNLECPWRAGTHVHIPHDWRE